MTPSRDSGPGTDPYDLARFVEAQADDYARALSELRSGRKQTHWMWYVFPQLAGLGRSPTAQRYAIRGVAEAAAFLEHRVLGSRLVESAEAVLAVEGRTALEIFGAPDHLKLHSSATLFAHVAPGAVFDRLLQRYFDGRRDDATMELLAT